MLGNCHSLYQVLKRSGILQRIVHKEFGIILRKKVDLGEPTSFLDLIYTWCAQKDKVKKAKILWTITEPCSNHEFQRCELKNLHTLRIFVFLRGLMTWPVMQRSAWRYCELAN